MYPSCVSVALSVAVAAVWSSLPLSCVADTTVDINLSGKASPFEHIWKKSFGSGHAKLTVRPDWQAHLKRAVDELGLTGVRYHGIFDDDNGPVVMNTSSGIEYNFSKIDASWDYQLSVGVVPIVELSFMPAVLAGCTWNPPGGGSPINPGFAPCAHTTMAYRGITEPPTDFDDWAKLVVALAKHALEKYGPEEVHKWHFEVWNELWGMAFPSNYMQLFNASSIALKSVDPMLKIGGPATAQLQDVEAFVEAATAANIPFDFVSTHMYPTDPECGRGADWGPDCFNHRVKALREQINKSIPLYMTEYNVGCCLGYPQHDTPGAAAFIYRTMDYMDGVTDALSYWTFTDVFEEGGFPTTEFSNIYGLMTVNGIPKPGWRAFQLLNLHAGSMRIPATVTGSNTSVSGLLSSRPMTRFGNDSSCFTEPNTNLNGFDILPDSDPLMLPTSADCCTACRNHTGAGGGQTCTYWTYGTSGRLKGRCYLKTSDAGRATSNEFISGSTHAPPPPPPPSQLVSALATVNSTTGDAAVSVFIGLWVNGGPASNSDNRTVMVNLNRGNAEAAANSKGTVTAYIIDTDHANPKAAWEAMGAPRQPSASQLEALTKASQVIAEPMACTRVAANVDDVNGGTTLIDRTSVLLTPNSAVLLIFE